MEFRETAWKSFRNLKPRRQKWCSGLNILLGPNGSGKTNLLESFSVLCGWGAFAGNRVSSLVSWNGENEKTFLAGWTAGERDVEIHAIIGARMILRAENERVTYSALRSLLPSLSFLPQDINLIDGTPSIRRLFLDKLCALCSPLYARRLAEYRQLVRHRTALLRKGLSVRATTLPMVQLGGWIWANRRKMASFLAEKLAQETSLLPHATEITLCCRGSSGLGNPTEELAVALETNMERERHARLPLVGPHRDDLLFSCLDRPATLSLSRGQKRRVVMAAILAAGRLIEEKLRLKPILLLDDIAAELDAEGREMAGLALAGTGWQVFITGVEEPFKAQNHAVYRLSAGVLSS